MRDRLGRRSSRRARISAIQKRRRRSGPALLLALVLLVSSLTEVAGLLTAKVAGATGTDQSSFITQLTTDGATAIWPLQETSGTEAAEIIQGANGIYGDYNGDLNPDTPSPPYAITLGGPGPFSGALAPYFEGNSLNPLHNQLPEIDIPDRSLFNNAYSFTYSAWVAPESNVNWQQAIFRWGMNGIQISLSPDQPSGAPAGAVTEYSINVSAAGGGVTSTAPIPADAWSLVQISFSDTESGDYYTIYANGHSDGTASATSGPNFSGGEYPYASWGDDTGLTFQGYLADLAFFSSALNSSQVTQLCTSAGGCNEQPSAPLSSWSGPSTWGGGTPSAACTCDGAGSTPAQTSRGRPINTATGDLYDTTTDLTVPAPGLPLTFTRSYDAEEAQSGDGSALGRGWSDDFGISLTYTGNVSQSTDDTATVTEENGSQDSFTQVAYLIAQGTLPSWCASYASADSPTQFCPNNSNLEVDLTYNSTAGTWVYDRYVGGLGIVTFPGSGGGVDEIQDADGDSLQLAAPSSCVQSQSCVWTSKNPAGSSEGSLTLDYGSSGKLLEVVSAPLGTTTTTNATFCYYGSSCAASGPSGQPSGALFSATDPNGLTTYYTYDSSFDLLTMSSPTTSAYSSSLPRYTNTYTNGQATEQVDPAGAETTFCYTGSNSSASGGSTIVVTYPGTVGGSPCSPSGTYQETTYNYRYDLLQSQVSSGPSGTLTTTTFVRNSLSGIAVSANNTVANSYDSDADNLGATPSPDPGTDPTGFADILSQSNGAGQSLTAYNANNLPWCQVAPDEVAAGVVCPSTPIASPPTPGESPPTTNCPNLSNGSCLGATITYYDTSGMRSLAVTDPTGYTSVNAYTASGQLFCTISAAEYASGITCPSSLGASPPTSTPTTNCPSVSNSGCLGATLNFYNSNGQETGTENPDGGITSYAYANATYPNLPTTVTTPVGTSTTITYNSAGQPISSVATTGSASATTLDAYDAEGRVYCSIAPEAYAEASGAIACPTSPPSGTPPTTPPTSTCQATSSGFCLGATLTVYNADNQPVYVMNPLGGVAQTAYDGAGDTVCTVSPTNYKAGVTCPSTPVSGTPSQVPPPTADTCPTTNGNSWCLGATLTAFDGQGRPIETMNPLGGLTTTVYDSSNNVVEATVQSGSTQDPEVVTCNTYNVGNQLASTIVNPATVGPCTYGQGSAETEYAYDPGGRVYCTLAPDDVTSGSCPQLWEASWVTPPAPSTLGSLGFTKASSSFTDPDGNVVQSTDPDGNTTETFFDPDGAAYCTLAPADLAGGACPAWQSSWVSAPLPSTLGSLGFTKASTSFANANGEVVQATDADGDTTSTAYSPSDEALSVTNGAGAETTNCYYGEANGCASSLPAGGQGGELYSSTSPVLATTYTYAADGSPATTATAAGVTAQQYDANGDLTSTSYPSTAAGYSTPASVTTNYNVDGSRATMTDATGTTGYAYNPMGQLKSTQLTSPLNGLSATTVSYTYYASGALQSVAYPASGSTTPTATYTYDARGNMASLTDGLGNTVAFTVDGDGNLTNETTDGTSSTTFAYDPADQNTSSSTTLNQTCGGSETLTQTLTPGPSAATGLTSQLANYTTGYTGSCSGQASTTDYDTYDSAGRLTYQNPLAPGSPGAPASPNFSYDGAGDPTAISEQVGTTQTKFAQAFNAASQITSSVSTTGGPTTNYTYDTLGDQVESTSASATASYSYDQIGQLSSAITPDGSANYLDNGDGLEAAAINTPVAWSPSQLIDGGNKLDSVSCPSSTFCMAVDNRGDAVTWNGQIWSSPVSLASSITLNSVSCPTTSFCAAVDSTGDAFTWNGSSWTEKSGADGTHNLKAVSCPSTSLCIAIDARGYALSWNGSAWSSTAYDADGSHSINSVSCPNTSTCIAVDSSGEALSWPGSNSAWTELTSGAVDTNALSAISCPTTSFCELADGVGNVVSLTHASGWSATSPSPVDSGNAIEAVSCAAASACEAVDNDGNVFAYDGGTWSSAVDIDSTLSIQGVSCPGTGYCAAVGANGFAVVYAFTAEAWSDGNHKDGSNVIDATSSRVVHLLHGGGQRRQHPDLERHWMDLAHGKRWHRGHERRVVSHVLVLCSHRCLGSAAHLERLDLERHRPRRHPQCQSRLVPERLVLRCGGQRG